MKTSRIEQQADGHNDYWTRINAVQNGKSFCVCGHRGDGAESQHEDRTEYAPGHGACKVEGCSCKRFRWDSFVAEKEGK